MDPPPSRILLILLLLVVVVPDGTAAENFSFDFPSFSPRNLTLLGASYLRNGSVGLTRESGVPCSSTGAAVYNNPIRFRDPAANLTASFSTTFSFSITNAGPECTSHGLAFFLFPAADPIGGAGDSYLGVFNSSASAARGSVVAVKFDPCMDLAFRYQNVGFDVDGPLSINASMLESADVDLKSGNLVRAWIDYLDDRKLLEVRVSYANVKPNEPVLSQPYDLAPRLEEYMYAGFAASTEGSTEVHTIFSWSFEVSGFAEVTLSSSPSNSSAGVIPPPSSANVLRRRLSLGLGIACPVIFCAVAVVVLWFFVGERIAEASRCFELDVITGPRKFSYRELSVATRGFHASRAVGSGAFGTVYRAVRPGSGEVYAVKRSKHSRQGKEEFMAELRVIAGLRHKNLVQLQGWCDDRGELLLVYEFMPNGSLDRILHHRGREEPVFGWPQRCNVARGIAAVLAYLHQECEQQVIHRDVKTSNVMLDVGFNPRLGDFGLARLTDHNKSPLSTLTAGTMGYLAPEYLQYGKATEKTDVFSFGVMLLEVCCGRRPIDRNGSEERLVNLVDWVWGLHARGSLLEAADGRLGSEFDRGEMERMLLVGLGCANPDFTQRPSMRRVVQILNGEVEPMQVPRVKPCLTFTCSLPLSLDDIVSDAEESVVFSPDKEGTNRV